MFIWLALARTGSASSSRFPVGPTAHQPACAWEIAGSRIPTRTYADTPTPVAREAPSSTTSPQGTPLKSPCGHEFLPSITNVLSARRWPRSASTAQRQERSLQPSDHRSRAGCPWRTGHCGRIASSRRYRATDRDLLDRFKFRGCIDPSRASTLDGPVRLRHPPTAIYQMSPALFTATFRTTPTNFARNSRASCSNIEFRSFKIITFQRLLASSKRITCENFWETEFDLKTR